MATLRAGAALGLALIGLVLASLSGSCHGALQVGFYNGKCRVSDVEAIVAGVVAARFSKDPTVAPALLRMQFHDCFVTGCDASILLDGKSSEKTAPPNLSVKGYDVIDSAKAAVEAICPGVVSCADIIVMATRDAVSLSGGGRYRVETGRKDGLVSLASNVDLPPPSISVNDSIAAFAQKGLTVSDMVLLLGGHTIGIAHCSLFQDRLYNYQNTGKPDPTMDPSLASALRSTCPNKQTNVDNIVNLDQDPLSSSIVDNSFYKQILARRGILQIDQEIALDRQTKDIVGAIAGRLDFSTRFGEAMVKLGTLQNGAPGEIRQSCRAINTARKLPTSKDKQRMGRTGWTRWSGDPRALSIQKRGSSD
ncbi:peroxidase 60 [Eucalyptus grandis]|uniref:peroxidase 60 n=1 Tax=Eucalyptus grandis TaxID=71139 RepID=UPI00192EFA0B|nr:peroxidase 60 [Eucalyptus grandis]